MDEELGVQPPAVLLPAHVAGHDCGIGVERILERCSLLQKTPDEPAPSLIGHDPLEVRYLYPLGQAHPFLVFFPSAKLGRQVERIDHIHNEVNVAAPLPITGTSHQAGGSG